MLPASSCFQLFSYASSKSLLPVENVQNVQTFELLRRLGNTSCQVPLGFAAPAVATKKTKPKIQGSDSEKSRNLQ